MLMLQPGSVSWLEGKCPKTSFIASGYAYVSSSFRARLFRLFVLLLVAVMFSSVCFVPIKRKKRPVMCGVGHSTQLNS